MKRKLKDLTQYKGFKIGYNQSMVEEEKKFVYNDFGIRLREWLEIKGMTQTELADEINVKKQQLTRWLSGRYIPSQEKTEEIADALGLPENLRRDFLEQWQEITKNGSKSTSRKAGDQVIVIDKHKIENLKNEVLKAISGFDELEKKKTDGE